MRLGLWGAHSLITLLKVSVPALGLQTCKSSTSSLTCNSPPPTDYYTHTGRNSSSLTILAGAAYKNSGTKQNKRQRESTDAALAPRSTDADRRANTTPVAKCARARARQKRRPSCPWAAVVIDA